MALIARRVRLLRLLLSVPLLGLMVVAATSAVATDAAGAAAHVSPAGPGYWLVTGYGTSYAFNAPWLGNPKTDCSDLAGAPSCDGISTAVGGNGYWLGASALLPESLGSGYNPGAFPVGSVPCPFDEPGLFGGPPLATSPLAGIAATPEGAVAITSGGQSYDFCPHSGGQEVPWHLNQPVVGIALTPDGSGSWVAAADGGVFASGSAQFYGSLGGVKLNKPIVGIAATSDGKGYWLVASDGGVFAFGDAQFHGSMGGMPLNKPMAGIADNPDGTGYWTVASDGGVFAFGDAPYLGSAVGQYLDAPIVGIASRG